MTEAEDFDKDLAAHLRARARDDQDLPPEQTPVQEPDFQPESTILLTAVQATMQEAAYHLSQGQGQVAAITMQMALCQASMANTRALQELSGMYIAFKTGAIRVINVPNVVQEEADDAGPSSSESELA